MKHSFKRFLSSVLATVMAVSVLSVGMVSEAFAAAYDNATVTQTSTSKTWDFSGNITGVTLKAGDTVNDIVIDTISSTKLHASGYFTTKAGSAISVPVPANSEGTLTIVAQATQTSRYATLEGQNIIMTKGDGASAAFTAAETADGDLDLTFAGGECKILTLKVDLTTGSFGEVATYTLTGACSGLAAGTTFDLTDGTKTYEATVAADGASYTVSTQSGAFDTTKTYTASIANYTTSYDSAAGVTLTADTTDATKFTAAPAITFTAAQLTAIPAGTYVVSDITAGLPNFDISALVGNGDKYTGDIKFILSDTATVTINGKCGSSEAAKSVTATIGADTKTAIGGGSNTDYVFSNVAAGETTLTFAAEDTTFQIASITIAYGTTPIDTTESTEATTEDQSETTSEEQSETTTEAPVAKTITDTAKLTFAEADVMPAKFTADEDKVFCDYFTIHAVGGKSQIAKGNKTFDNGETYLGEFKTGSNQGTITFTTSGAGTVQIAARSSSKTDIRTVSVTGATSGVLAQTYTTPLNGATEFTVSTLIELPAADTYTINCDGATNFFAVNVIVGNSEETIYGDTDNDKSVTQYDASLVAQSAVGLITFDANALIGGNVDGDADITQYDASLIAQYAVGLINSFPVENK